MGGTVATATLALNNKQSKRSYEQKGYRSSSKTELLS